MDKTQSHIYKNFRSLVASDRNIKVAKVVIALAVYSYAEVSLSGE